MKKVVTHNGKFHSDEVFACATLMIYFDGDVEITRTRDKEIIKEADIVVDVGRAYDPSKMLFDHHQKEGAGVRDNGIPYASFGLVWKEFGEKVCGSKEVSKIIEDKLVQSIDAGDNGVSATKDLFEDVKTYKIGDLVSSFLPTWKESIDDLDDRFQEVLDLIIKILKREIQKAKDYIESEKIVEEALQKSEDKRLIILDQYCSFHKVLRRFEEPLMVVYPISFNSTWGAEGILSEDEGYDRRLYFPEEWAGKEEEVLEKASGVSGAVFCHRNLFLAINKTKEGAIAMAEAAILENGK